MGDNRVVELELERKDGHTEYKSIRESEPSELKLLCGEYEITVVDILESGE